ncbi:MAG TPA: hypothetical protein VK425_02035 [Acidimicrobiales bacterium]|nr:hypothetical protein [Acidimicrobiales bacterium]
MFTLRGSLLCAGALLAAVVVFPTTGAAATATRALSCPACGHNLILNPGAEAGPGAPNDTVVAVPDWKATGGFTATQYAWSGGDVSETSPGPPNRGKNYFYGGPDAAKSTGTQLISVPRAGVSYGRIIYNVSAWLGGYDGQEDDTVMYVIFEGTTGAALSTVLLGPVTEAQRRGESELLYRHKSGLVPAATQTIKVELVMTRYQGSDNDGLADNLSLVLTAP